MAPPQSDLPAPASPGPSAWKKIRLPVTATAVAICVATIVALSLDARQRILRLDDSREDRLHWLIDSTHDDVLELDVALLQARLAPQSGLAEVRRRFGDLEQRIRELDEAPRAAPLIHRDGHAEGVELLRGFLADTAPVIEGPDLALAAALPGLSARLQPLAVMSEAMQTRSANTALQGYSAEQVRIGGALLRLVLLTVLLVVVLSVLSIQLLRLYLGSKERAEENRRTSARLETIFATSADAILVTDLEGRVLDCNPAAQAMFGYPAEALLGGVAMTLLFPPDVVAAQRSQLDRAVRSASSTAANPLRLEVEAQQADGLRFPVEVTLAVAPVVSGSIVVALVRDISARRRAERELTEARDRALAGERAKANFLAVMSHEMRTPLNGLTGSIELMAQTPLDTRQRELVRVLSTSAEILLDHVNSVLDIARFEANAMEAVTVAFDLDRLVADCAANQAGLAAAAGNRIELRSPGGALGMVMGNPVRLRQILLNLLNNAAKFTRNGRITVETVTLAGDGDPMVEIRVIDTGIGIAATDLERIFEDFVTLDSGYDRRSGGTGLGLGISRRLARAMGGDLGALSMPHRGSRFWLRLPLLRPEASDLPPPVESEPALPAEQPRPGGLTVLIIEDNDINRFIARSFIESEGHAVVEAADGMTGLIEAQRQAFDVVLTDISMPGLDGFQVARRIREGGGPSARSRIVALTAHSLSTHQEELRDSGLDAFLQKPVGRAELLRSLHPGPAPAPSPEEQPEPEATPADPPVLDPSVLDELRDQLGPVAVMALIRQMLGDGDMILQRIAALGPAPEPAALAPLAHQFAGAIGTFGAHPLHRLLRRMMQAGRGGDRPEADLAALPGLWQATRLALQRQADRLARQPD